MQRNSKHLEEPYRGIAEIGGEPLRESGFEGEDVAVDFDSAVAPAERAAEGRGE